jgi:hypothetical protein
VGNEGVLNGARELWIHHHLKISVLIWVNLPLSQNPVYVAVIQLFAQYMGSVSTVTTVKWLWFLINVGALAGVLVHLARIFKASADAKGGEVAQLYGAFAHTSHMSRFLFAKLVLVHVSRSCIACVLCCYRGHESCRKEY